LLLCDEPTAGVDPQARNAIFDMLESLNRGGTTIIYSTHYMEEAARLCSRIGIMDHGRLLAGGTLAELLGQLPFDEQISFPVTPATTTLVSQLALPGRLLTEPDQYHFLPASGFRLSEFFALIESRSLPAQLFTLQRPTLEALFLHLTGRTLRE
jgi:ABC-2 type transport system ATP-binding protein